MILALFIVLIFLNYVLDKADDELSPGESAENGFTPQPDVTAGANAVIQMEVLTKNANESLESQESGLDQKHIEVETADDSGKSDETDKEEKEATPEKDTLAVVVKPSKEDQEIEKDVKSGTRKDSSIIKGNTEKINKDLLKSLNRFHRKQKRGTIDVWWLFDDGG